MSAYTDGMGIKRQKKISCHGHGIESLDQEVSMFIYDVKIIKQTSLQLFNGL